MEYFLYFLLGVIVLGLIKGTLVFNKGLKEVNSSLNNSDELNEVDDTVSENETKTVLTESEIGIIEDEKTLAEIVLNQKSEIALQKISDTKILQSIEEKLDNQYDKSLIMIIKCKIHCPELNIAKKANNYEKLIEIAETNPDEDIKLESLENISGIDSENLIKRLVKIINTNNHNSLIQQAATNSIGNKNQSVLVDLTKNGNSGTVRSEALMKLDPDFDVYQYMAANETDSAVLERLAVCLSSYSYRKYLEEDYETVNITKDLLLTIFKKISVFNASWVVNIILKKEHLYNKNILAEMGRHLEREDSYLGKELIEKLLSELNIENIEKKCSNCEKPVSKFSMAEENCPHCNVFWSDEVELKSL
ncbi:MAG: HEAT repeat domain-containing protein [Melioribacteraceae bacterium]|nr:HEAT repeat domain-containing protein [Melioribacteraceae bacterium]